MKYSAFELHRQSDDLIYRFQRGNLPSGVHGFRRDDNPDLWITWRGPDTGWVAFDDTGVYGSTGRPWDIPPHDQDPDHPPEGIWVSRKNEKSYVYKLVYVD
jgi:hypothetical protein